MITNATENALIAEFNAMKLRVIRACQNDVFGRADVREIGPSMARQGSEWRYGGLRALASACFHTGQDLALHGYPSIARDCSALAARIATYVRANPRREACKNR